MDRDEILRLKQITGLTALFQDVEFGKAWQPSDEFLQETEAEPKPKRRKTVML